jgi:hypothetical protein
MRSVRLTIALVATLTGCASGIVQGDSVRLSPSQLPSRPDTAPIEIVLAGLQAPQPYEVIGKVSCRAWLLEKGFEEAKRQARLLGADALVNVRHERRFSADYLQDLYFIEADAVVWKTK